MLAAYNLSIGYGQPGSATIVDFICFSDVVIVVYNSGYAQTLIAIGLVVKLLCLASIINSL
jgi:hypothetical protein